MRVNETVLVEKLEQWLHYCDLEKIAELAGEAFGGDCYITSEQSGNMEQPIIYEFEPNEHYSDEFDDLEDCQ